MIKIIFLFNQINMSVSIFRCRSHEFLVLSDLSLSIDGNDLLQPYVNTKSGNFDTWPAQTTNLNHSDISGTLLSKGKCFTFRKDSSHMKASIVRKPRFLEQLEKYLQHELQCLNIKSNNCHELRLQVC